MCHLQIKFFLPGSCVKKLGHLPFHRPYKSSWIVKKIFTLPKDILMATCSKNRPFIMNRAQFPTGTPQRPLGCGVEDFCEASAPETGRGPSSLTPGGTKAPLNIGPPEIEPQSHIIRVSPRNEARASESLYLSWIWLRERNPKHDSPVFTSWGRSVPQLRGPRWRHETQRGGNEWVGRVLLGAGKLWKRQWAEFKPKGHGEESAWQCLEKRLRNTKCKDWEARSVWPDQTEEGQEETKEARWTGKELSHRPLCHTYCTIIAVKPYWRQYRNSKAKFNKDQGSFFLYNPLTLACGHIVSWSQIGCQGSRHCILHTHETRRETALLSTKKTKVF